MCSAVLMILLVMPVWASDQSRSLQEFIDSIEFEYAYLSKKNKDSIVNWLKNLNENKNLILSPTRNISGLFRIRLQRHDNAKLKKGKRTIRLVWYGGQPKVKIWRWPPLKITKRSSMRRKSEKQIPLFSRPDQIVDKSIQVQNKAVILNLQLEQGLHFIKIHDDAKYGKTQRYWFTVVDKLPSNVPNVPIQAKKGELLKQTFLAIWLATQGKGEWEFEAYQLVTDKKMQGYYPASLVKIGLEAGNCPRHWGH
jgi:hypothetical protein